MVKYTFRDTKGSYSFLHLKKNIKGEQRELKKRRYLARKSLLKKYKKLSSL